MPPSSHPEPKTAKAVSAPGVLPTASTPPWTHGVYQSPWGNARSLPATNGIGLCCDVLHPYRGLRCTGHEAGLRLPGPPRPQSPLPPPCPSSCLIALKQGGKRHYWVVTPSDEKCTLCQDSANTHTKPKQNSHKLR